MSDEAGPAAAETNPLQFTLRHLFLLTFAIAVFLSLGVWLHWLVAVLAAALAWVVWSGAYRYLTFEQVGIVTIFVAVLVSLLLPAVRSGPDPRRAACFNRLKQIGLALHAYAFDHGCLPPAVVTDANGRPMHSWRVLILPYMEQKGLYDQYSFDEPWDGPNNSKLHGISLRDFLCRKETGPATNTSYVAVTGPGTAWGTNRGVPLDAFTDDVHSTIAVVEIANSGIHWMEPRDLDVTKMAPGINPIRGQGISSLHGRSANALLVDGSAQVLRDNTPPKEIQAMLTIAGGEEVALGE